MEILINVGLLLGMEKAGSDRDRESCGSSRAARPWVGRPIVPNFKVKAGSLNSGLALLQGYCIVPSIVLKNVATGVFSFRPCQHFARNAARKRGLQDCNSLAFFVAGHELRCVRSHAVVLACIPQPRKSPLLEVDAKSSPRLLCGSRKDVGKEAYTHWSCRRATFRLLGDDLETNKPLPPVCYRILFNRLKVFKT